jgi:SWI/SNF related-matrix-associated actin-dependent regulator of chromatin subfamily C
VCPHAQNANHRFFGAHALHAPPQAIVARFGGEVVPFGDAGATHTMGPAAPTPAAGPGEEAYRVVDAGPPGAGAVLLHTWHTPNSCDAWVRGPAAGDAAGDAPAAATPPAGGWRLPLAWLLASEAAHELLNEADFDSAAAATLGKRKRPASEASMAAKAARGELDVAPGVVRRAVGVTHADVAAASVGDGPAPGIGSRIENISQGQVASGAPAPRAPPSGPVAAPAELARLPAYASWFQYDVIHEVERKANVEFFAFANSARNVSTYRTMRNAMVRRFREDPGRKITFTECRAGLVGDVNAMHRVFTFLEHWGIINWLPSKGGASAPARPPPATTAALAAAAAAGAGAEGVRVALGAGAPRPKHALYEFEPPRPSAEAASTVGAAAATRRSALAGTPFACNACGADLTTTPRYHSLRTPDYDLCAAHYAEGRFPGGSCSGDFVRMEPVLPAAAVAKAGEGAAPESASAKWSEAETLLLLEGVELHGDAWADVAAHVGSKSKPQCLAHFLSLPIEDRFLDEMEGRPVSADGRHALAPVADAGAPLLPFEDAGNPVMAQVAFLSAVVGPRVAAAAAAAALEALEAEGAAAGAGDAGAGDAPPTAAAMRVAAATALGAAAVKAKLLADQEARDMQRLVVGVIDTQLRKMELKFKQLEELEDALRREADGADASRASLASDRAVMAAYKLSLAQAAQAAQQAQAQAAQAAAAAHAQQQQQQQQQNLAGAPPQSLPPL